MVLRLGTAFLATMLCSAAAAPPVQPPAVSCEVDGQESRGTVDQPVELTGVSRAPLRITVRGTALQDLRVEGEEPTVQIAVFPVTSVLKSVSHRFVKSGSGETLESRWMSGFLTVPVSDAERTKAIEEYLAYLEDLARTAEPPDTEILTELQTSRAEVRTAFEKIYIQNQLGLFRLECSYLSKEGAWKGAVTSPLYMHIVDSGRFFDQPQFRK